MKGSILVWRWLFFIVGIIIVSAGVALTIHAPQIGVGSWDVLHVGLSNSLGLTVGMWSIIIGAIILAIDGVIMKRFPKMGTILDMLLTGLFVDVFDQLLPVANNLTEQIVMFVLGSLLLGFGCGMYIIGNVGVGPRDTFMLLIVNKLGWSVVKTRTTIEITVAILGVILGGPLGIGTVIMAFALGPIIQWSMKINEAQFYKRTGINNTMYS